jgi:hypothetical protein
MMPLITKTKKELRNNKGKPNNNNNKSRVTTNNAVMLQVVAKQLVHILLLQMMTSTVYKSEGEITQNKKTIRIEIFGISKEKLTSDFGV